MIRDNIETPINNQEPVYVWTWRYYSYIHTDRGIRFECGQCRALGHAASFRNIACRFYGRTNHFGKTS